MGYYAGDVMTWLQRKPLGISVLEASRQRIAYIFDHFEKIYVSFSGGKDSTVMLHLVIDEAKKRNRKVAVLFIDWEAQFKLTIDHIIDCYKMYADYIEPYWIAIPLRTTNACSMIEPEWTCWEPGKEHLWVRQKPESAIGDGEFFPFYVSGYTFEEFVPEFGKWYSQGKSTACLVGIRCGESLDRFRTLLSGKKVGYNNLTWTTYVSDTVINAYPVYDWKVNDIWAYNAKFNMPYNRLYDRMYQAGLTAHQMRICEPYGDEQRKGLWLYHVIEPETWGKVVDRVAGANTGALYAKGKDGLLGNGKIELPKGHTWKSYAMFLLDTMPVKTAEHYKNKIAVWLKWYDVHNYPGGEIPDCLPGDTGAKDMPSWRRVCKVLLKNDYWCKGLCFSPTKTDAYKNYENLMKRRRSEWGLI